MSAFPARDLREALESLSEIRGRVVSSGHFRGYRSATVAATSILGIAAALMQSVYCPDPQATPVAYINYWITVAIAGAAASLIPLSFQAWQRRNLTEWAWTKQALERLLPSLIVGAAASWSICDYQPSAVWLLPALWCGLFGLAVLNSSSMLPVGTRAIGSFYLVVSLLSFAAGNGPLACSAWWMGTAFGAGQAALAILLYRHLEAGETPVTAVQMETDDGFE